MENSMARMMMETINNMLIEMYAVFAQVEIEKKEKRQKEGIAAKKLRGEWDDYGRPTVMEAAAFASAYTRVEKGKITATALQRELGLSHSTFYRYRATHLKTKQS
jgi:DNA invertase Pin-like site-specific DNA recombinase